MSQVIEVSVSAGSDDAEEVKGTGQVFVNSSDLELINDSDYVGQQTVGIRFDDLDIPPGATITAAWVEFTVDETDSVATTLNHQGAGVRRCSDLHVGELQRLQPADDDELGHLVAARMDDRRGVWPGAADRRPHSGGPGSGVAAGLGGRQRHRLHRGGQRRAHGRSLRIGPEYGCGAACRVYAGAAHTPPTAVSDAANIAEDIPVTVAVLDNDTDADGHPLTVSSAGQPAHGAAVVNANGTITYTPAANFNGVDSFSYTISDGQGGTASATASVNVAPLNDAPVAVADTANTTQGSAITIAVLANDTDRRR